MPRRIEGRDMEIKEMTSQEKWVRWLTEERHISMEVAEIATLSWNERELTIPVYDKEGKFLFNKYRRAPWREEGPKYRYDTGSTACLYGVHLLEYIPHGEVVVLTEGELDALVLQTLGFHAMSSTGGAGTWRQEWSELLQENHRVIIAYDADEAGVRGALKVASMTPLAAVAWLPVQFGKDPTEIVHNGGVEALIDSFSSARILLVPPDDAENRRDKLHELQQQLNGHRIETLNDRSLTPFHIDLALAWVTKEILSELSNQATSRSRYVGDGSDKERARSYPIRDLIKVNRENKALCPFHDDRTPSMHVYHDNHAFCFVCMKRADAIDIYMAINNVDFKTAIAALI
jgi:DNA primase